MSNDVEIRDFTKKKILSNSSRKAYRIYYAVINLNQRPIVGSQEYKRYKNFLLERTKKLLTNDVITYCIESKGNLEKSNVVIEGKDITLEIGGERHMLHINAVILLSKPTNIKGRYILNYKKFIDIADEIYGIHPSIFWQSSPATEKNLEQYISKGS